MSEKYVLTKADRLRESADLLEKAERLRRSVERSRSGGPLSPLDYSLSREADEAEAEAEILINSQGRAEIERLDRIGVKIIEQYEDLLTQADRLKAEIATIAALISEIERAEADEAEAVRRNRETASSVIAEKAAEAAEAAEIRRSHLFRSADQWINDLRAEKADRYCEMIESQGRDQNE